jgi:hypothetical protein
VNGPHAIVVNASGAGGYASGPVTVNIVIDLVPPSVPSIVGPVDGAILSTTTPTVSGIAEPGSTVRVETSATNRCTTTAGANGSWTCTLPTALPQGPTTISVWVTDPAGNQSATASIHVTIDTQAPSSPSLSTNGETFLSGTADTSTELITVKNGANETVCTARPTASTTPDRVDWSCLPTPALRPGEAFSVTSTDAAGNASVTNAHVVALSVANSTVAIGGSQTMTVLYLRPGETVRVILHSGDIDLGTVTADAAGTATLTWVIPHTVETGTHSVEAIGSYSGSTSVIFQVTPPAGTIDPTASSIIGPSTSGAATGGSNYTCNATSTPGQLTVTVHAIETTGAAAAGAQVVFSIPAGLKAESPVETATDASGVARLQVSAQNPGTYDVTVSVEGTAIVTGSPARVRFDEAPDPSPILSVADITPANATVVAGDGSYLVTYAVTEPCGKIGGHTFSLSPDTGLSAAASATTGPDGKATVAVTAPNAGTFTLRANLGGQIVGTVLTFVSPTDVTPPAKPTLTASLANGVLSIQGIGFAANESVTIYSDQQVLATKTADASGQVSYTWTLPTGLAAGQHTLRLVGAQSGDVVYTYTVSDNLVGTGATIDMRVAIGGLVALCLGLIGLMGSVIWRRRRSS